MPTIDDEERPLQDEVSEWKPQDGPRFRLADLVSRGARKVGDFLAEKPPGIGYTPGDLANDMVVRPLQRTAERVAYGENPFTTGKNQTLRLRDDAVDTAMNAAPFAGALARPFRMGAQAIERAVPMEAGKLYGGLPALSPAISMSEALAPQKTTLRTLENLPDKAKISKSTIQQQLARPEVTKSERDVMEKVLSDIGEDSVSANTLVKKVAKETEKFGLAAKDSDEYADYGLARIGRYTLDLNDEYALENLAASLGDARAEELHSLHPDWDAEQVQEAIIKEATGMSPQNIRTTQWELPIAHGDTGNHFGNPKYFGHTRAFEQDAIPHVVEIQSDLAQKGANFKALAPEEKAVIEGHLSSVEEQLGHLETCKQPRTGGSPAFNWDEQYTAKEFADRFDTALTNIRKTNPDVDIAIGDNMKVRKVLYDALPTAEADVVRDDPFKSVEVLQDVLRKQGDTAKGNKIKRALRQAMTDFSYDLEVLRAEHRAKLNGSPAAESVNPMLKNWDRRLIREELSRAASADSAPKVVRFADADTVAKVEAWPKVDPVREAAKAEHRLRVHLAEVRDSYEYYRDIVSHDTNMSGVPWTAEQRAAQQGQLAEKKEFMDLIVDQLEYAQNKVSELTKNPPKTKFSPEHQGIYDRYKKDVEKYLKQLGGTDYVDDKGHRWIEVPVKPSQKRTQLFNVGAGAAGAGAAGAAATGSEAPSGGF